MSLIGVPTPFDNFCNDNVYNDDNEEDEEETDDEPGRSSLPLDNVYNDNVYEDDEDDEDEERMRMTMGRLMMKLIGVALPLLKYL